MIFTRMKKTTIIISGSSLLTAMACLLVACHNLTIPLQNDSPHVVNDTCVQKTLYYPDSIVCTLAVEDRNDTVLAVRAITSDTIDSMVTTDTISWIGHCSQLNSSFETKYFLLTLPQVCMGSYQGLLMINDLHDERTFIPYLVNKTFIEPFNTFPDDTARWRKYNPSDTMHAKRILGFSNNYVLKYFLDTCKDSSTQCYATGVKSNFSLKGDFSVSVEFEFINLSFEKLKDAKISFIVSNSSDTSLWSGIAAGISLFGVNDRLTITAGKGLDAISQDFPSFTGYMKIQRKDEKLSMHCWYGNPDIITTPLKIVSYSAKDSVFIHLCMSVKDLKYPRYSMWDNVTITKGQMIFR